MDKRQLAIAIRSTIIEMGANTKAEAKARAYMPHVDGYKMVSTSHLERLVIYAGALATMELQTARPLILKKV